MAFGNFGDGGMLDGIKSKLGFADNAQPSGYRSRSRSRQSYDDYDDYNDDYDDFEDDYEEDKAKSYEPYSPVTTRPAGGSRTSSSSFSSGYRPAKLVSIDDVRAHTTVPESLNRDPLPQRKVTPSFAGRVTVDAKSPLPNSASASHGAHASKERSESLDSLFDSTADLAAANAKKTEAAAKPSSSFDPYKAYEGVTTGKHNPTRSLTVVKPDNYGECELVAKALKAGDAVVLVLAQTPEALAKRVLDFSFGASSALDASVDCVADKVFVIARGQGLTDAERKSLSNQGIL